MFSGGANTRAVPGVGEQEYSGISGTGYLSLVYILRKLNLVHEDGRFNRNETNSPEASPLARKLGGRLRMSDGQVEFKLTDNLKLTGTDLEELLKVKAAFSLAVQSLFSAANLAVSDLRKCYLAGALGKYAQSDSLFGLGFLPDGLKAEKVTAVGNAALTGSELLLREPYSRILAARWAAGVKTLNLTSDESFMRFYLNHMRFCFPLADYA
jgi:uncharacterized 2Fe-2S/4Fe-4S cluster protein (DUF4445 family)